MNAKIMIFSCSAALLALDGCNRAEKRELDAGKQSQDFTVVFSNQSLELEFKKAFLGSNLDALTLTIRFEDYVEGQYQPIEWTPEQEWKKPDNPQSESVILKISNLKEFARFKLTMERDEKTIFEKIIYKKDI